jgi:hypothetical protein
MIETKASSKFKKGFEYKNFKYDHVYTNQIWKFLY